MFEGPQVKLRAERLTRRLQTRNAQVVESSLPDIRELFAELSATTVEQVECYGKHIVIDFCGDRLLHNHLLTRGRSRRMYGGMLCSPEDAWPTMDVEPWTIVNLHGQMMLSTSGAGRDQAIESLGPDGMEKPYPRDRIEHGLRHADLTFTEALLDQAIVAGIGNIARSEILFMARIDPRKHFSKLTAENTAQLHDHTQVPSWTAMATRWKMIHWVYWLAVCARRAEQFITSRLARPTGRSD